MVWLWLNSLINWVDPSDTSATHKGRPKKKLLRCFRNKKAQNDSSDSWSDYVVQGKLYFFQFSRLFLSSHANRNNRAEIWCKEPKPIGWRFFPLSVIPHDQIQIRGAIVTLFPYTTRKNLFSISVLCNLIRKKWMKKLIADHTRSAVIVLISRAACWDCHWGRPKKSFQWKPCAGAESQHRRASRKASTGNDSVTPIQTRATTKAKTNVFKRKPLLCFIIQLRGKGIEIPGKRFLVIIDENKNV